MKTFYTQFKLTVFTQWSGYLLSIDPIYAVGFIPIARNIQYSYFMPENEWFLSVFVEWEKMQSCNDQSRE